MKFRPSLKSLKAFALAAILGGTASGQEIDWNYLNDAPVRYEAGGIGGDQPGVRGGFYRTGVFMALFEDQGSILFVDGHGNVNFDSGNWSGDIGMGYRRDLGGMVLGGNAYYNVREYSNGLTDHRFSTVGIGVEALMENWAVRSNGYLTNSGQKSNGLTAFPLIGGPDLVPQTGGSTGVSNIRLATQTENFDEALDGFDLTVSRKFPAVRSELGVGVYRFSADGGPSAWGASGTADMWMTSNIAANITISHDDLFDSSAYGGVTIYFGGPAIDAISRTENVTSQLWSRVQRRHVAPVLNYTTAAPDLLAHDAGTGDLITVTQIAMGDDLLGAPGLMEDDGDFIDIILVDPDATFGPTELPTTIALNDDQRLLSAHLLHGVDTFEAGMIAIPESGLGGGPAVLIGATDVDVITLANNNEVSGFEITSDPSMLIVTGIRGTDVTDFNINRNTIIGGVDIDSTGLTDISGTIASNTINDGDFAGVRILGENIELLMTGNTISGNESENVLIEATGEFVGLVMGNEFNDSLNGDGFQLDAVTIDASFVQNIANNNDEFGFNIEVGSTTSTLEFIGNTANLNGLDGLSILFTGDDHSTVNIDMNTADGNMGDGISLVSTGMGDILGSITNNTTNNNDPGIFIQSNDAASDLILDITGNISNGNTNEGISIFSAKDFDGLIEGNVASMNGLEGFRLDATNDLNVDFIDNDFSDNDEDGLFLFVGNDIDANLLNNTFSNNGSDGVQLNAGNDITGVISENTAVANDESGLFIFANGNIDLDVLDNMSNDNINSGGVNDAGISLLADGNIAGLVDGNTANGNAQSGILMSADNEGNNVGDVSAIVSNNTAGEMGNGNGANGIFIEGENITGNITDNTAGFNIEAGISVNAANDALIGNVADNMTEGNGGTGLEILAGNDILAFVDMNTSNDNDVSGIKIEAGGDLIGDFFSNTTNGNIENGMRLNAVGAILGDDPGLDGVVDNTANGNGTNGIIIVGGTIGTAMNTFLVDGNTAGVDGMLATGNAVTGIHIESQGNAFVTVSDNNANHNDAGIFITSIAGDLTSNVTGNIARNNTNHGIQITGDDTILDFAGDVSNNNASANGGDGIHIDGILNFSGNITGNLVSGNSTGISATVANDFTGNVGDTMNALLRNIGTGNTVDGLFFDIGNDFTGDVAGNEIGMISDDGIEFIVGNDFIGNVESNTVSIIGDVGLLFDITNDFTGDFVNNNSTVSGAFDYDTNAGGTVTGAVSPNTSTTNTAVDFNGNIATP